MKWNQFIELICSELQHGDKLADFGVAFEDEHSLTRAISLGIRDLFTDTFRNAYSDAIRHLIPIDSATRFRRKPPPDSDRFRHPPTGAW